MSILFDNPPPAIGCGDPGDPIDYGCLFDGGQVLERAFTSSEEGEWTLSAWVKITDPDQSGPSGASLLAVAPVGGSSPNNGTWFGYLPGQSPQGFYVLNYAYQGSPSIYARFDRLWRDPAAWAHIYLSYSIERPVGSRYVMRVNGGLIEDAFYNSSVDEFNRAARHAIGGHIPLDGGDAIPSTKAIFADYHFVSGREVAFTEFAYRNSYGHWVPKRYQGDYGDNGFHLNFADPLDLGKDVSRNGNHFAAIGMTVENQVTDTPTNNLPTFNPAVPTPGNLTAGNKSFAPTSTYHFPALTQFVRSGIWWAEFELPEGKNPGSFGVMPASAIRSMGGNSALGYGAFVYHSYNGALYTHTSAVIAQSGGKPLVAGDVANVLLDLDNFEAKFFVNGALQYTQALDPSLGLWSFFGGDWMSASSGANARYINLRNEASEFEYPAPDGATILSSSAMPCPEILNPDDYFTTRLACDNTPLPWNALTGKTLAVTKDRDAGTAWRVNDTVRGSGKAWACDVGGAEINEGMDGVTWTAQGPVYGSAPEYQGNRATFFWRASPKAGFDIVGPINHGLGSETTFTHHAGGILDYAWVVPLDGGSVRVYPRALPNGAYYTLNSEPGSSVDAGWFSSTVSTGVIGAQMPSGRYMVYAWRAVSQFSEFGAAPSNGLVDGPLWPMDFLPRLVMVRNYTTGGSTYDHFVFGHGEISNPATRYLMTNLPDIERQFPQMDFNANGVKIRGNNVTVNPSGSALIPYAAWAETPGKFARAR